MSVRKKYAPTYKELKQRQASRPVTAGGGAPTGGGGKNCTHPNPLWDLIGSKQRGNKAVHTYRCPHCPETTEVTERLDRD